jgi:hypothetical protein
VKAIKSQILSNFTKYGTVALSIVIPPALLRSGVPWGLPWEQLTCLRQVEGEMTRQKSP